jgi:pilus assembly protein TadC
MTSLALLLFAAGLAMCGGPDPAAGRRLRMLGPGPAAAWAPAAVARHATVGLAAAAAAMLVGGIAGAVVAVVAGAGIHRVLRRLEPAASRRLRERRAAQLPITLDLLAVCLRAGSPLVVALDVVAGALAGPLAADLAAVAGLQRLGASVVAAWSRYEDDPVLGSVARSVYRSARSGSALASALERLAVDRRAAAAAAGEVRARRAGVLATAPLGLCFLPAFVCLGVVPLVLSIADSVFG